MPKMEQRGSRSAIAARFAAGLGIGRRIEPAVRLGNGAQGIGRELVSEMLEVDVLVAVDQRQRRLAYK